MITKSALEKIGSAPNAVDSVKETIAALADDQTISHDVAALVNLALDNARVQLEPVLRSNLAELEVSETTSMVV